MVRFTNHPVVKTIRILATMAMTVAIKTGCVTDGPTAVTVVPIFTESSTTRCQLLLRSVKTKLACHRREYAWLYFEDSRSGESVVRFPCTVGSSESRRLTSCCCNMRY